MEITEISHRLTITVDTEDKNEAMVAAEAAIQAVQRMTGVSPAMALPIAVVGLFKIARRMAPDCAIDLIDAMVRFDRKGQALADAHPDIDPDNAPAEVEAAFQAIWEPWSKMLTRLGVEAAITEAVNWMEKTDVQH